jgi:hypothetical protein
MLKGYIDDSGSAKSNLFTLSCLVGHTSMWPWIELAWTNCIDEKNKLLRAEGRKELTRFHAADCSSRLGDFKGWTVPEQIEFMSGLIRVFERHPLVMISFTLDLGDLIAEFPEVKEDPRGLAHVLLITHIMKYIADKVLVDPKYRDEQITLIHERSDYDSVILEAFNHVKNDKALIRREQFEAISSGGWEKCVPLQLADFIAYENFKITERESVNRPRRRSMELVLDLDSIGGRGAKLQRAGFQDIRERLDAESKQILFKNARIQPKQKGNGKAPEAPHVPKLSPS